MLLLEYLDHVRVRLKAAYRVVTANDLVLRHAEREQLAHVIAEHPAVGVRKRDAALLEADHATLSAVDRRPWKRVLLPCVRDGREPRALLRLAQPLEDRWLARLVEREVSAVVVEVREQAEVEALLAFGRVGHSGRLHPRARPRAGLAYVRARLRAGFVLICKICSGEIARLHYPERRCCAHPTRNRSIGKKCSIYAWFASDQPKNRRGCARF